MLSLGWGGVGGLGKDSVILMRGSPGVFKEPWGNTVSRESTWPGAKRRMDVEAPGVENGVPLKAW